MMPAQAVLQSGTNRGTASCRKVPILATSPNGEAGMDRKALWGRTAAGR